MSPHVHGGVTVSRLMSQTMLALAPAAVVGIYYFGWGAVKNLVVAVLVAVAAEAAMQRIMKKRISVCDGHAALIGLLLALMFPPGLPWWGVALGAVVAIVLGKQIYGGLGNNPFNPAAVGWIVMSVAYPNYMALYYAPQAGGASFLQSPIIEQIPLTVVRGDLSELLSYPWWKLFFGYQAGGVGEVCIAALLLGGIYLIAKGVITWHAPVGAILSAAVFTLLCNSINPEVFAGPSFHLLTGGLVFSAFFLVTDKGTTPVTRQGKLLAGVMVGALTILIRYWGGYPDGVFFAVLLTNAITPLLDRIRPAVYGRVKKVA